ncbi:MAG: hypothetical protein V4819_21665 [Verrucomicrobiota bacterium]
MTNENKQHVQTSIPASFEPRETLALGETEPLEIELTGLLAGASFIIETLNKSQGNAMAVWESLDCPEDPTREQTRLLRQSSMETIKQSAVADASGRLSLHLQIEPWSVISVRGL